MQQRSGVAILIVVLLGVGCSQQDPVALAPEAAKPGAPAGGPGRTTVVGRAPAGSVVALEPASRQLPLPEGPAILDQYARTFVPDMLVVRVGQPVQFRNSEDIDHNVAVVRSPTGTRVFDTSTPPYQMHTHTFDRPGRYDVSCDIHPGMRSTIIATNTPYVVVVDATGRFSFPDLEPGSYKLTLSAIARPIERTIDVKSERIDLGGLTERVNDR